jgi:hypothetical protein
MTEQYWGACQAMPGREHQIRADIEESNRDAFLPTLARTWIGDGKLCATESLAIVGYVFFRTTIDDQRRANSSRLGFRNRISERLRRSNLRTYSPTDRRGKCGVKFSLSIFGSRKKPTPIGALSEGFLEIPWKGGHNDLRRWKSFGGVLERPEPPSPIVAYAAPPSDEAVGRATLNALSAPPPF